jgi:hypothetical protein
MENPEVPIEHVHEEMHHQVHASKEKWISWVALSTAFLAAVAAVASLLAGHYSNEAMLMQIRASDQWGYFQAKGIKAAILETKRELLKTTNPTANSQDFEKSAQYEKEREEIKKRAEIFEEESEAHLRKHSTLARAVTLFQIAISVSAIAVLMRQKRFWIVSLVFGLIGIWFLIQGLF